MKYITSISPSFVGTDMSSVSALSSPQSVEEPKPW